MSLASGSRTRLTYVEEVTMGVTPDTPSMLVLRTTGRNINLTKNVLQSSEIRPSRQVSEVRHGFNRVEGSIPFELAMECYDDMLAAALAGTWETVTAQGAPNWTATAATSLFTRSAGSNVSDGFRPGDIIETSDFAESGNNGTWRVTVVAALTLTVDGTLTDEAVPVAATVGVKGKRLDVGTTLTTFSFERQFLDIDQYQVFKGCAINSLGLSIQPESMVTGNLGIIGMSASPLSGSAVDASPTDAETNSPFTAFDGDLYEGETALAICTGLDFTLDNGRVLEAVVGSQTSPEVFEGTADVTGTLTAFFEDAAELNKFINETKSSIWCKLEDIGGSDFINIVFPEVFYTGGAIDPPQEGPVPLNMPFRAVEEDTYETSMWVQKSNA